MASPVIPKFHVCMLIQWHSFWHSYYMKPGILKFKLAYTIKLNQASFENAIWVEVNCYKWLNKLILHYTTEIMQQHLQW